MRAQINNLITRAVLVSLKYAGALQVATVTVGDNEAPVDVEYHEPYGYTSRPARAVGLMLKVAGHRFIIALNDLQTAPKQLSIDDVMVWHREGDFVHLKGNGDIEIKAATRVLIDTPEAEFTGNIKAHGDIIDNIVTNSNNVADMRDIYNGHNHPTTSAAVQKQ